MQLVNRKLYLPAFLLFASVSTVLALTDVRTNPGGPPTGIAPTVAERSGSSIESNAGAPAVVPATSTEIDAPTTSTANPERIEAVVLTVFPTGFDPAEVTLSSGDYVLAVYNRSGIREITWQLHRESGERLHEERTPRRKPDWVKRLHLREGVYLLTAENQPRWRCRIIVTSR